MVTDSGRPCRRTRRIAAIKDVYPRHAQLYFPARSTWTLVVSSAMSASASTASP